MLSRWKHVAPVFSVIAVIAWLAFSPVAANAQGVVAPASQPGLGALDPDSFYGKEPSEGVYVRDSAGAVEELMLAQKMERLKNWKNSAELYQEVINKYLDRVVPARIDRDNKIYQYTSILGPVQEHLAKWPKEGLDVYRSRYEAVAEAELAKGAPDDAATLNRVYLVYFVTDAGKKAGITLMDLYMEQGQFPAAAWIGQRLLSLHPNLGTDRPAVLFRTALADHFAGNSAGAQECLKALHDTFPNEHGTVRGKDVVLASDLSEELQTPLVKSREATSDAWPMFGGDDSRARISPGSGKPGARLYAITLAKPASLEGGGANHETIAQQVKNITEQGLTLGVMPVVDRGELFFQDGAHVYAVSVESGVPLPGWAQTWPDGVYTLPGVTSVPRAQQTCVTLTERSVLAIMGMRDYESIWRGITPDDKTRLVCLDRATGREKWSVSIGQIAGLSESERMLQLAGSPLVVGDSVLVFGVAGKQAGFEDAYVVCFDLNTGKHRWSTYVASSAPTSMLGMQMPPLSDNSSHLAYASGRVFVQTNLGAVASLDAYTGSIDWLDIYPTEHPVEVRRGRFWGNQPPGSTQPLAKPWAYNPIMVRDGKVFSLPTDSKNILIYDAGTGAEIKRIDLNDINSRWQQDYQSFDSDPFDRVDTLVGVIDDKIVVASERSILCLNWNKYDRSTFSFVANDSPVVWAQTFGRQVSPLRGRPFMTHDSVFYTTGERLYRIPLTSGKRTDEYPHGSAVWESPEGPGNIIVTNDHVIIAGLDAVNVYTDLTVAKEKLDREMAASPTDVEPRLKYAEVMLAAGEPDNAIKKIDDAIKLLGGEKSMQTGAMRDRLFTDSLTFAQKLGAEDRASSQQFAQELFDRADMAASSPNQQVHYRLARAKFSEKIGTLDRSMKLYNEILADASMRAVPMVDNVSGAPSRASRVAQGAIAALIGKNPALYEPIQQAANAAYQSVSRDQKDSATQFLDVAEKYPNSTVAPKAMLAAADAYEAGHEPQQAIRVLRQMWFEYPQSLERGRILESMARNYFAIPNHSEAAAAALARATSLPVEPHLEHNLKLPDGKVLLKDTPVAVALEAVRRYRVAEASKALPDFQIPIPVRSQHKDKVFRAFDPQSPQTTIDNIAALLVPDRECARNDRVVAWSTDHKLLVFAAGKTSPLLSSDAIKEQPSHCGWSDDALLVWGASQMTCLRADGRVAWRIDLTGMPQMEIARLDDSNAQVQSRINGEVVIMQNGQVWIRQDRRFRMNMARGVPMPGIGGMINPVLPRPAANAPEQIGEVKIVGDHVLLTTSHGRILAAEIPTGRVSWQARLSDRPIDRLVANEDFTVVKITDETGVRLAALDTSSGLLRCTKNFSAQNGMVPVNLALAVDGTLVYTLPDRICLKDLYKPWPDPTDRENADNGNGPPPFVGATQPDQLQISEGRILALADAGSEKFVNIYSLETGQPVKLRFKLSDQEADANADNDKAKQSDQTVDRKLVAGKSWNVVMKLVGPHLYLASPGPGILYAYNLDRPAETWTELEDDAQGAQNGTNFENVRHIDASQKYLAVIAQETTDADSGQADVNAKLSAAYRLYLIRRTPVSAENPAESGLLDYVERITDPAGVLPAWQPVEGGFYYLTGDSKLHMLRGSDKDNH